MIAAGIVLYNADLERLHENIMSVKNQVDILILIDNGSKNIDVIQEKYDKYDTIHLKKLGENKGIAVALNEMSRIALSMGCEWILTLDQDSVCSANLIACYMNYINVPKIAMMSCKMKDRNYCLEKQEHFYNEYVEIEQCITSGCFMNLKAAQDVGFFDEKMFIDYVDFDMCAMLKRKGYCIILCNFDGLLHELGRGELRRFIFKKHLITNHSPIRRYYYMRNVIYYTKKHKEYISLKRKWKELYGSIFYDIAVIVLYEKDKVSKLQHAFKGICDGIKMQV